MERGSHAGRVHPIHDTSRKRTARMKQKEKPDKNDCKIVAEHAGRSSKPLTFSHTRHISTFVYT